MKCVVLSLLVGIACASSILNQRRTLVSEVNAAQNDWVASVEDNWVAQLPREVVRHMLGNRKAAHTLRHKTFEAEDLLDAPDAFDARTNWPDCKSMGEIRDQAACGSCWAFGAVEAMSDRYCIAHKENKRLSAEDMNSCSGFCGGCDGGYDDCAWEYWASSGVVTEECYPYSIPGCDHHIENSTNPCPEIGPTPACKSKCQAGYAKTWKDDKTYASDVYYVTGEKGMMAELEENGPCEVSLTVYEDFLTYKSGIYHHVKGVYEGGHAVKAVGWGVENSQKYWIIANSWNEHWGEKGLFRIRKGSNECGIEGSAYCGIAK